MATGSDTSTSASVPTSTGFVDRVAACTLDEFESHAVFTVLLHSLSRPGTFHHLPPSLVARFPAALAPLAALGDVDVTLTVIERPSSRGATESSPALEDARGWSRVLAAATGAHEVTVDEAAMVAALEPLDTDVITALRRGDALHPELGARLVMSCRSFDASDGSESVTLELTGPGIDDSRHLTVGDLPAEVFTTLATVNAEFPAGIDTWLVSPAGTVVGLPRTTSMRVISTQPGTPRGGH
jgi:alpha-D-ribose 1-methylphosphonate 5-triphosphate synthase subunit PhnH